MGSLVGSVHKWHSSNPLVHHHISALHWHKMRNGGMPHSQTSTEFKWNLGPHMFKMLKCCSDPSNQQCFRCDTSWGRWSFSLVTTSWKKAGTTGDAEFPLTTFLKDPNKVQIKFIHWIWLPLELKLMCIYSRVCTCVTIVWGPHKPTYLPFEETTNKT